MWSGPLHACQRWPTHPPVLCRPPPAAVAVLGACLFPLAPNWAKLGVFYASSGLLMAILALLLLRSVLAVSTVLASGRTLWLLPNLMSEASARLHCLVGCMCLPARLPGMAGL